MVHVRAKKQLISLRNFNDYLHYDQYAGYKQLPDPTLVGCWAHLRHNFIDAAPQRPSQKSLAQKAIATCNQMFRLERSWADLSNQKRQVKCDQELRPLMVKLFDWCRDKQGQVLPKSKLGQAFTHSLNHEEAFKNVFLHDALELSNDMAERSVKSVIMGRKNWLFSQSYVGARSSAIIISIIETTKRH